MPRHAKMAAKRHFLYVPIAIETLPYLDIRAVSW
jgi:hypothetical protein